MLMIRINPKPMEMPMETSSRIPLMHNPKMMEDMYSSNIG
jgi:hypothetical protein